MQYLHKIINTLTYLLIFFLPWQTRYIYQIGKLNNGTWEYGTLSLYATELFIGLILILGIIYSLLLIKKKNPQSSKSNLIYFTIFILLIAITIYFAIDQQLAIYKTSHFILGLALIFLILTTKPNPVKAGYSFVFAGVIQAIMAIHQFTIQKVYASSLLGIANQDPNIAGVPIIENNGIRILRSFGSLPHPNILGGFLAITLIIIIGLTFKEKIPKRKIFLFGSFILITLALFTTASRSALLSLLVGLFFIYFFTHKKNKKSLKHLNKFLIIFIIIMVMFSILKPEMISRRFTATARLDIQSNQQRLAGYHDAWTVYKQNWLTGTGPGNYTLGLHKVYPNEPHYYYQPLHNAIILPFIEMGLPYLLIFISLILLMIYLKKKKIIIPPNEISWYTAFVAILIISLFDHYFYSFYFGIILTSIIIAFTLQKSFNK